MIKLAPAANEHDQSTLVGMSEQHGQTLGEVFASIDPWLRYGFEASSLTAYLTRTEVNAPRFAILMGTKLAGAIGIRETWLSGPYLQFLGVLPEFQTRGLGQLALAWFEGNARARRDKNIWVAASEFNVRALHFYESRGFKRAALLDDLLKPGFTEVLLRKKL